MKVLLVALALTLQPAPGTELSAEDEARAQALMREIKCMVCSGESILDSNAPMALDMRRFVREQMALGRDEEAVRQAMVDRFGHEVLLRPPLDGRTVLLFLAPVLFLVFGGALLLNSMKRKPKPS